MHLLEFKNTIKKRREMLQVSQETLAALTNVALRTIKQIETGNGNPTLKTLEKIADVLGLEISLQLKKMNN